MRDDNFFNGGGIIGGQRHGRVRSASAAACRRLLFNAGRCAVKRYAGVRAFRNPKRRQVIALQIHLACVLS
jgi:hypothetical protein